MSVLLKSVFFFLLAIAGFMMVQKARTAMKSVTLKPRRTIETLKDDVQWAKELRP